MLNGLLFCRICPDEGGEGLAHPFQQQPRNRILPLLCPPLLGISVELLLDQCPVACIVLDNALLQSVLNGVRVCLGPAIGEPVAPVNALNSLSCIKPLHNTTTNNSVDDSNSRLISLRLRSSNTSTYCLSEGSRKRRA